MDARELEIETYEEASHAPRKYSDSDDPYAIKPANEESKAPSKYPALRGSHGSDEVKVSVSDPVIREETLTKHVVYTVRVKST